MAFYVITGIFWITCFAVVSFAFPITDEDDAALYLKNFGYLEETDGAIIDQEAISTAIKYFQNFAGISETGELDDETITMMNMARCGVKDKIRHSARRKRYTLQGSQWRVRELTYRISKYPSRFTDHTIVKNEIARAFKIWSDVTGLNFKETLAGQAHIDIRFEVGDHGHRDKFDGPGNILAHASFPQYGGDAHFDDEEMWTISERFGTNLFQVAAHEFGHSLGLMHSAKKRVLMAPFYWGYIPGFQLHSDDVEGIQALYGPPLDDENMGPPSDTGNAPNLCEDATIDTITRTQSGNRYVFKGGFYWKVLPNGIAEGYPRKISDDWVGLPGNLDASVTWTTGKTYFFKGMHYWRFTDENMDSDYPKLISAGFQGIPDSLDAALICNGNDQTYFFKGNQYWRFDLHSNPHVLSGYPQPITEWSNLLAGGIDAAFPGGSNRTYFFKGEHYYRYNDISNEDPQKNPITLLSITPGATVEKTANREKNIPND